MSNLFFKDREYKNVTLRPFNYISPSVGNTKLTMLILLLPQIIMLVVTKSGSSLLILFVSIVATLLAEGIYYLGFKVNKFDWLTATIQGVLIGMLLPSSYPPIALFFIIIGTMILTKYAFGGFANSWVNPVVITIIVAYFINMSTFPAYLVSINDLQSRNPALVLIQDGKIPKISCDASVTAFFNDHIFKLARVAIPEGYVSLFWDCNSVIPAFRFNLLTLVSSIILISLDMLEVVIPACFITTYMLLVKFISPFIVGGVAGQGDMLLALLTSGTLFSTLYLLQWYGTTPVTQWGKISYGITAGVIAFLVIGCGTSSAGYVFTVLLMNIISPIIQVIESRNVKHHIEKTIVPRVATIKESING